MKFFWDKIISTETNISDINECGNKIFKLLNKKQKELFGFNSIVPKFNLKNQSRNTKTLRNIKSIGKSYTEALKY